MSHRLLLLRHAKSSQDDPSLDDHRRPLNKRGSEAARSMAAYLDRESLRPGLILCSTAERTRRTVDPIKSRWPEIPIQFEDDLYLGSVAETINLLHQVEAAPCVLVVGHNPTTEILAHHLIDKLHNENTSAMADLSAKYPTGALTVIDFNIPSWPDIAKGSGCLDRFVKPRDLES